MRVLVIDDSLAVRVRLVARLREAGLEVVGDAGTGADALILTRVHAPDAIILDVLLPDRNGLELIGALRGLAPALRVVILSNDPQYRRHCLAAGADAFLDKSTEFDGVATFLATPR